MTDKEKVLKVWPGAYAHQYGVLVGQGAPGHFSYQIFSPDRVLSSDFYNEEAAWQNAAESLPSEPELEPRHDPSFTSEEEKAFGNLCLRIIENPYVISSLSLDHLVSAAIKCTAERFVTGKLVAESSIPPTSTNSPAIPDKEEYPGVAARFKEEFGVDHPRQMRKSELLVEAKEDKCGATFADNMPWRICNLREGHDAMYHYDGIYWVFDARKQKAKECTCPTSQWVGSEPNDSTCTLSEEEHQALEVEAKYKPTKERELFVPREVAHALWVEGGRLRSELSHSLSLYPENWHQEALRQYFEKWDAVAGRYFDIAISSQPSDQPTQKEAQGFEELQKSANKKWWVSSGYTSDTGEGGAFDSGFEAGWNAALSHKEKL